MKTVLKNFRATPDESERWEKALKKEGKRLSDVCSKALNRFAARVEKENQ